MGKGMKRRRGRRTTKKKKKRKKEKWKKGEKRKSWAETVPKSKLDLSSHSLQTVFLCSGL